MSRLCCCCNSCKPRYQRLVDNIYPRYAIDGLVQNNMQKLTFYAISHPEKLSRIGIYLVKRLSRDLNRQRYNEVKTASEALEQLLKSCHASPSLNQFTESYLRMVQKLLETGNSAMECLATDLFVRFSSLEEDSPSYHRQYDFFISRFSSMCHAQVVGDTPEAAATQRQQRYNGLRGLRGVIWKSASDDLHANIWEPMHMNKIVPSILYNFQEQEGPVEESGTGEPPTSPLLASGGGGGAKDEQSARGGGEGDPHSLALQCLRELFGKSSFGTLKVALAPVLQHLDAHSKWTPPALFAQATFKTILYSIPASNSSFVIQEVIQHLEHMPQQQVRERIGVATLLSNIVSIAGTTIGPLLLAIFNSLMKQLRASVEFQQSKQCKDAEAEKIYQDTIIEALGDFGNALPVYQKLEIMMFTMSNIPVIADLSAASAEKSMKDSTCTDQFLQKVLVKTLLKVATSYRTFYLASVFTDSFLRTLLQLTYLPADGEVKLDALNILNTLLDRHENHAKLAHLPLEIDDVDDLHLSVEKSSRQDLLFMRRQLPMITTALYRSASVDFPTAEKEPNTMEEHYDAILCTMALLCVEVGSEENLLELFRLALALQQLAIDHEQQFSAKRVACIHGLVAKSMNLGSQLMSLPALCSHVQAVIKARSQRQHINLESNGQPAPTPKETTPPFDDHLPRLGSGIIVDDDHSTMEESNHQQSDQFAEVAVGIHYIDSKDMIEGASMEGQSLASAVGPAPSADQHPQKQSQFFDINAVAEALQGTVKDVQRLFAPFKPRSAAITSSASIHSYNQRFNHRGSNGAGNNKSRVKAMDYLGGGDRTFSPSGIVLSQSLNVFPTGIRKNESAVEGEERDGIGGDGSGSTSRTLSIDTSSIDWSPPDTPKYHATKRNAIFTSDGQTPPLTVDALREALHAPRDRAEEVRREEAKSRQILQQFRGKTVEELSAALSRPLDEARQRSGSGDETLNEETLAETIQRLVKRNEEWTKMHEFGHPGANVKNLYDIKFPPGFMR